MTDLVVAGCATEAASHAVSKWHYSQIMPTGKLIKCGVWEDERFIGAVLFGRGASPHLGTMLGLDQTELCELVRVALRAHESPVTQIVAKALKILKETSPNLRAVVSFADPAQGHHGGIYQAGNWTYTGTSAVVTEYRIGGRWRHTRGAWNHPARPTAPTRLQPGKHRYLKGLDKQMARVIRRNGIAYPSPADEGSTVIHPTSGREV